MMNLRKLELLTRKKKIKLLSLCNFCPNDVFRWEVIKILCGNDGLFSLCSSVRICKIYAVMERKRDDYSAKAPKVEIYPLNQSALKNTINRKNLVNVTQSFSCGHDLPVWINDPCEAQHRIMVLSQDPRRNKNEMGDMEIGISSPFGLHSIYWRSNKNTGMIHQMAQRIINDYGEKVCFYYTDILKLRGTDSKDMDLINMGKYKAILCEEIKLFKPTIVLLLGKEAKHAYDKVSENMESSFNATPIELPHPNARIKNGKWGGFDFTKYAKNTEGKIKFICGKIMLTGYQKALIFLLKRAGFETREIAAIAGNFEQEEQELKDQLLLYLWDNNPTRQQVLDFLATLLVSS